MLGWFKDQLDIVENQEHGYVKVYLLSLPSVALHSEWYMQENIIF